MTDALNRRRSALAEIPMRMGRLRVSTDDMPSVRDSPLDNIPIGYLTPSPSPDELVIRQRGRRRISIHWSPEKIPSTPHIHRTPTSSLTSTTTMTLRSSPRKRLHLPDAPSSPMSSMSPTTPEKPATRFGSGASGKLLHSLNGAYSPQAKRLRLIERPVAQRNDNVPLTKILKGLSQSQLINVIQQMINNEPDMERNIRSILPMPDIKPMEEQLIVLKKNIFKSLPSSRLVKSTDSVAFSRASIHLAQFKKFVIDQAHQLNESQNWDALLDFSVMAWSYVGATPVWDNTSHNVMRRSCFKILSYHCLASLKLGAIHLGEQRLNEFYSRLERMKVDCDDITLCMPYLERLLLDFYDQTYRSTADDTAAMLSSID